MLGPYYLLHSVIHVVVNLFLQFKYRFLIHADCFCDFLFPSGDVGLVFAENLFFKLVSAVVLLYVLII